MSVSSAEYLKGFYNTARAMGDKSISSDAYFEIEGYEHLGLLAKQFPFPTLGPAGEIEIAMPMGAAMWQAQQIKVNQQGQLSFNETVKGHVTEFMEKIVASGGYFQATVYEGTPDRFHRAYKLRDCFFQPDNPDRDVESRSQVTMISGTLFFHYFSEKIPGNIPG
jgi:hypothetical protein